MNVAMQAVAALAAAAGEDIEMDGPTGVRAQLAWMKENARAARAAAGGALWVDQYRPTDPDKLVRESACGCLVLERGGEE